MKWSSSAYGGWKISFKKKKNCPHHVYLAPKSKSYNRYEIDILFSLIKFSHRWNMKYDNNWKYIFKIYFQLLSYSALSVSQFFHFPAL